MNRHNEILCQRGTEVEEHLKCEAGQVLQLAHANSDHVKRIQQLTDGFQQIVRAKDVETEAK